MLTVRAEDEGVFLDVVVFFAFLTIYDHEPIAVAPGHRRHALQIGTVDRRAFPDVVFGFASLLLAVNDQKLYASGLG